MKRIESTVNQYFEEKLTEMRYLPMPLRLHKGGQLMTSMLEITEQFSVHFYELRGLCELKTKPEEIITGE